MDNAGAEAQASRAKGPRLYHKKSRNGCQRCRSRKVKCDEKRPVCGNCNRHSVSCAYADRFRHSFPQRDDQSSGKSGISAGSPERLNNKGSVLQSINEPVSESDSCTYHIPIDSLNLPESAERRLLELRLLHHFLTQTCTTFSGTQNPIVRDVWAISIPQIANNHPSLLYALLSVSALHLSRLEPKDLQLQNAHRTYFVLALQNHRFAINKLDDANNADATCFTSILIFISAYAALQDRVVDPYAPPMQWLHVSNGARDIFRVAIQSVQYDTTAVVHTIVKSIPALSDLDSLFQTSSGEKFSQLLLPVKTGNVSDDLEDEAELQDEETRVAYANTITYLGSVYMAIERKDHTKEIRRWLLTFAVVVPRKMIWLIEAKRPRAFIILAHYFALVGFKGGAMEAVWWIGRIARREIEAIQRYLPGGWQHLMGWPLAVTEAAGTVAE